MIARRITGAIFVCLIGILAAGAQAQEDKWKTVRYVAFGGYVLSHDQPTDWIEWKESFHERGFRFKVGKKTRMLWFKHRSTRSDFKKMAQLNKRINFTPGTKYSAGRASFTILQHDLPRPLTVERWFDVDKRGWKNFAMIVHGEGTMQVLGKKAFYYLSSGKTAWKGGKKVPATAPTSKKVFVVVDDRVLLEITFWATYAEQFKALQPIFDRMLKSIKVTSVAKLNPGLISRAYVTPTIRISRRRGYYLDISIAMILPPGWSAGEPIIKPATAAKPRGRMIVEIRRKKDPGGPSFLIVVEGMPPNKRLGPADYLATTDRLIGKLMARHDPGKTVKVAAPLKFFCMGTLKNRVWKGTGPIAHVRSYSGKDAKGRELKARVYTAGGFSAACNLIFIAQTKHFDKALPGIEAIVGSIRSDEYSPSFRR